MKITVEHFNALKTMIAEHGAPLEKIDLAKATYTGKNWPMRQRWDLLYSVPYVMRVTWFNEVYQYANDEHIDTALRRIMAEMKVDG